MREDPNPLRAWAWRGGLLFVLLFWASAALAFCQSTKGG
jgi:hypothetical protein